MGGGGHNGARLVEGCYLQRPPPKFTELLLSTTSVKIGSLPSQGPATVLAGAFALQSTPRATRVSELTFAGAALGATCPLLASKKAAAGISSDFFLTSST